MFNQIEKQIKSFQDSFGIDLLSAEQGSVAWLQSRLGVITASEVSKAVAKPGSETRNTYMCQLVAEVATGAIEEIHSKYLDWGKLYEPKARATYEFDHGVEIQQVGFLFKDDSFREGCSLDGFIKGQSKAVEIKCPYNPTNYIKFLVEDSIKADYKWQYQHQIRCAKVDVIDFVQFYDGMAINPYKALTVERDEEFQAKLDELIPAFIHDMDLMLKKIGIEYGHQWKRIAKSENKLVS